MLGLASKTSTVPRYLLEHQVGKTDGHGGEGLPLKVFEWYQGLYIRSLEAVYRCGNADI